MTHTIYTDLARAIEAAANSEGWDLTEATFLHFTMGCDIAEKARVFDALPTWAQRRIEQTPTWPVAA